MGAVDVCSRSFKYIHLLDISRNHSVMRIDFTLLLSESKFTF